MVAMCATLGRHIGSASPARLHQGMLMLPDAADDSRRESASSTQP
jgi:hypothetical protein